MTHARTRHSHGFTLVEMALVLVIIGLLVGGVMGGQSIIKGAELNATIREINRYANAVQQFRSINNALPGDMSNASSYWVSAGNGNGDRIISNASPCTETSLVWQHLALAGLIEGKYSAPAACGNVPGTNSPLARTTTNTYTVHTEGNTKNGDATFFDGYYDIILNFGAANSSNFALDPLFKPEDMEAMDKKMDDGLPHTGSMRTYKTLTGCYSGTAYLVSSTAPACRGLFAVTPINPL